MSESKRRYRQRKHAERYGPNAGDMRGKHGNHARGSQNPRWSGGVYYSTSGYRCIVVPEGHHLRQAHGYAYEHDVVMEEIIGRPLDTAIEVVHHINGDKLDNRPENLRLELRSDHSREHVAVSGARDSLGRFAPGNRVREFPR